MNYDYIVVGGGISGLNTCLKLVNGKNKILLLERNNRLGGRLQTYDKDGISYEIGGLLGSLNGLGNLFINSFLIICFSESCSESWVKFGFFANKYFKNLLSVFDNILTILI